MLRTTIQITALCLVLISAIFLVIGDIALSVEDMINLSKMSYGGTDKRMVENLTRQKYNTIVGLVLLLASFVLSLINLLRPMRASDFAVNRIGVMIAILVCVVISIGAYKISDCLQHASYEKVIAGLESKETSAENSKINR